MHNPSHHPLSLCCGGDVVHSFARIFCGTLNTAPTSTQVLHIFAPKFDPTNHKTFVHAISIPARQLTAYLFMGRDIEILKGTVCSALCLCDI